jgi:hypothetical protein
MRPVARPASIRGLSIILARWERKGFTMLLWKMVKLTGGVVVALGVLSLMANAALVSYTGAQLEERLKALRDAGDPVTLKDLAPKKKLPPEKNAATYLLRARTDLTAFSREIAPVQQARQDYRLTEDQRKALRKAVDAYPKLFSLLEQAANCPDYQSALDCTAGSEDFLGPLLDEVQKHREAANALHERACLHVAEGQHNAALGDAVTILRLARHSEREPLIISYLVACAVRANGVGTANFVLRSGPVSAKARSALDAELGRADDPSGYVWALKSERAYGTESMRTLACITWLNRAYYNNDQCYYFDFISRQIALAPKTYKECEPVFQEYQKEAKSWLHPLSNLVVPAITKTHEARVRTWAKVRCLRVFNALQQKAPVAGKAIPKLEALGLSAEAITDPYSGDTLRVRRVENEWLVYSVGNNLVDDGGEIGELKDVGVGPVTPGGN